MASPKIIELRRVLAERFPQQTASSFSTPTGWNWFDSALGGGLPKGAITQFLVPQISSGSSIILHEIIDSRCRETQPTALVDAKDCFDLPITYPHLLWARCSNALQAVKATDLLLRDGNLPFIILDLKPSSSRELRNVPATAWYRLQRCTEESRCSLLVITSHPIIASAQITISMTHQLKLGDLSTELTRITSRISLQISRRKIQLEYCYG
jgi:recA bacterial DNA recombination protein